MDIKQTSQTYLAQPHTLTRGKHFMNAGTLAVSLFSVAVLILCLAMVAPEAQAQTGATSQTGNNPWSQWKGMPQGKDFFPIGVWAQNPARAGQYKALGVDYYFGLHGGPTAEQMAQIRKYEMPVIAGMNDYAKQNLLNEPLIWGWMHGDEPDLAHVYPRDMLKGPNGKAIIKEKWPEVYKELDLDNNEYNGWGMGAHPVNDIQAGYKEIKQTDKTRPVFLQLSKAVATDGVEKGRGDHSGRVDLYPGYIAGGDIISFDIYPVAYGTPEKLWQVPLGVDNLKKWGASDKPVMAIVEAGFGEKWANQAQQRAQVWMAINHGASSITWFCHRWAQVDGKNTQTSTQMPLDNAEVGAAIKAINEEIHSLAAVINSPAMTGEVTISGAEMDISTHEYEGDIYLFAVERGNKSSKAVFSLDGIKDATVEVINEDRTIRCRNGRFADRFRPFGVHLYKIVKQ